MVGSIVVVGVLTCALLHSMCNLKAAQMNLQCSLIWELMIYGFELVHKTVEVSKNVCFAKDEPAVDRNQVSRWLKIFCLRCKNPDDQTRSGRKKSVHSKDVLHAIDKSNE